MYLCYIDESGTSSLPGNTSHFVLAGISIPISFWRTADRDVTAVLARYDLAHDELHTAWILRNYLEQGRIPEFDQMGRVARRAAVERERVKYLLHLQQTQQIKTYKQIKKNYEHTRAYIHLTLAERKGLVRDVADTFSTWRSARLFAEAVDKTHFDPSRAQRTVDEQAFEQVVSRFEQYIVNAGKNLGGHRRHGLLVHDRNETVARKHTSLMRHFQRQGTLWTRVERIIETPLFVDSSLTRLVQIADLCAYAIRRYLENNEADLFKRVFIRADRVSNCVVGVRHFTTMNCTCEICQSHRIRKISTVAVGSS